ncbi:5'-methylthioadenosine/S-adenosylhomocysteine nucleosidase [Pseudalkalibacillus caeni]|uniref:5'-methylthioadenosine/S-adenosylhomocysteine nucleosidase n=1 Tax=Exobacillus caeni TaxID=2574798 RepID=A0A5R9FCC1_9BACL|nr:5'-methylthioadenosine/S-adenosylhomocysteine nucleosidase [Pseudalkalibacillus caeni]TLS39308.1 5'-methylthioadenosine/S-adenosylhomocysteine nucleosidase [Pseudalkalibacillus caeni]
MRIGVIGAMDEEVEILLDKLEGREDKAIAGCEFSTGTYDGQDVILLKSGIGKVNAAMSTTLLNQIYKPDYVINTGSAGGFHKDLQVGDTVISTEVRHHDVDATVFGYEYGQVPQMPASFTPDPFLVKVAEKCAEEISEHKVVKGLIATGDSFMSDPERVDFVRSKFDNLYAAEMEAAAIAQVCQQFEIPFVIIRALSDIAGKESNVSFEQFLETAAVNSADLVLKIVKELKSNG